MKKLQQFNRAGEVPRLFHMKPKTGECTECGKSAPLIAKRCQRCYWAHRAKINAKKPAAKEKKERKQSLTAWFNMQLDTAPKTCENCGEVLSKSMHTNPRTIVCHIVKKSLFPEVATHPLNRWFGCEACHTRYDNGQDVESMFVLPIARARFYRFMMLIPKQKWYMIPDYLKTVQFHENNK